MARDWHSETRSPLERRRRVAAAIAEEERLHRGYREHRALAERWQQRAAFALAKGLEALARQALERQRRYQAISDAYLADFETQRRHVATLKNELQAGEATHAAAVPPEWHSHERRAEAIVRARIALEADPVADRLAALEREELLAHQLAELKARLAREAEINPR